MPTARYSYSRAGYRRAQDLLFPSVLQSPCAFHGADGGTDGGSADDHFLLFGARACGAERGHSSSSWSWSRRWWTSRFTPRTEFGGARFFPAATAEQIVDTPVPRDSRVLHPASSSSGLPVRQIKGFFALFPEGKKGATLGRHSGSELLPESSPSTLAAQLEDFFTDAAGVWMRFPGGWWKLLGSDPEVWRPG